MAEKTTSITIRKIDQKVKERLRVRASENGRSMEEEVRVILYNVTEQQLPPKCLYSAIRARIEPLGGVRLELPPRKRPRRRKPPTFD